jgi:hypothetical protein
MDGKMVDGKMALGKRAVHSQKHRKGPKVAGKSKKSFRPEGIPKRSGQK